MGVTAILMHSWSDFNMHIGANALLVSAILVFTAAIDTGHEGFKRIELQPAGRYALGTVLVAVCAAAVWFVTPISLATRYTALGTDAKQGMELEDAEEYYRKAISLDRRAWEPYGKLGDVYSLKARFRSREEERKQLVQAALTNYD